MEAHTSSNLAPLNEVQMSSLVHFGGVNEVQTVTFARNPSDRVDKPGVAYATVKEIHSRRAQHQRLRHRSPARRRSGTP